MSRFDLSSIAAASILTSSLTIFTLTPPASANLDSIAYTYMVTKPKAVSTSSNYHTEINLNLLGLYGLAGLVGLTGSRMKLARNKAKGGSEHSVEPSLIHRRDQNCNALSTYNQPLSSKEQVTCSEKV